MPQLDPKKILTREQRDNVTRACRILQDLIPLINALEDCGVDCSQEKRMHQFLVESCRKLDQHFVGGQP